MTRRSIEPIILSFLVQMEDAETQTEELSFTTFMSVMNDAINQGDATMTTHEPSCFNVIEEEIEPESEAVNDNSGQKSEEQESEMNTAL